MAGPRGEVDFIHVKNIPVEQLQLKDAPSIQNILIDTTKPESLWLKEATKEIGVWRANLRSTYMRWALAINGLNVAAERYGDPAWARTRAFQVRSVRPRNGVDDMGGMAVEHAPIAQWDGKTAAKNHMDTIPMLTAFGIIDIFANLETFVFILYRLYLNQTPDSIIEGDDFKELRKLKRDPAKDAEWKVAWEERLNNWHRKKLYDGLAKVFKAFCAVTKLKTPSTYTHSTTDTWAESLDMIAIVRNCLIHGASTVPANLAFTLGLKTTGLYKVSVPFSYQLCYRYLYGLDLDFNKQQLETAAGVNTARGNPKFLIQISASHGGALLLDNFEVDKSRYSEFE